MVVALAVHGSAFLMSEGLDGVLSLLSHLGRLKDSCFFAATDLSAQNKDGERGTSLKQSLSKPESSSAHCALDERSSFQHRGHEEDGPEVLSAL